MIRLHFFFFLVALGLWVRLCTAQASGWIEGQVNTTMCYWTTPRTAVVRDTLYIDGGYLWWQPGMSDGSYGGLISDGNPLGLVYLFDFGTAFHISDNISSKLTTISKAANGGAANNIGPNYYDGAMFANDYEWFTYGGLLDITDAYKPPAAGSVAAYEVYASGPPKQFEPGFILDQLPNGVTRYVTDGATVSVPSENLGFYFGGLRSADYGPIYYLPGPANESMNADQQSLTLIELDMMVQRQENWNNYTLPSQVPGRASAEVVWVPTSKQGILVAIGGVIFPAYANANQTNNVTANAASEQESPKFMSTVSVYDIANKVWYEQDTTGSPGALAQGCAVVATAQDGSSHNIYWYGGFDGLHSTEDFSDDIWVLSVPSFIWVNVKSGTVSHARAGHKCIKPYPDQMLVLGGYGSLSGGQPACLEGGIIQIFNLSSLEWIDSYDPEVWSNYSVPSAIYQKIGGSATGSATQSSPSPSGYSNSSLASLFSTSYNTSKITNWYPYNASQTTINNRPTLLPTIVAHNSGTPKYLAPVLGVVFGLIALLIILTLILLWRRRQYLSSVHAQSEERTMDNRFRVSNWLRGTPPDAKAPTITTDEAPLSPDEDYRHNMPEVAGNQVHEMMDTSKPAELHATGFVPLKKTLNSHRSNSNPNPNLISTTSSPHATSQTSRTSSVSYVSPTSGNSPRPSISPILSPRGNSSPPGEGRVASEVSGLSDAEKGHLRGISETSISTDGEVYGTPFEMQMEGGRREGTGTGTGTGTGISPLTPPAGSLGVEARDYLGGGGGNGNGGSRRSNFAERLDEG